MCAFSLIVKIGCGFHAQMACFPVGISFSITIQLINNQSIIITVSYYNLP